VSDAENQALACLTPEEWEDAQLVSVVKSVGPPPKFHKTLHPIGEAHKQWVLDFLASVPSPNMAARILGCSTNALYHHRRSDAEFGKAWDATMEDATMTMIGVAAEEALGVGLCHVVTKEGKVLTIPKERNDKLLAAFLLRESKMKVDHKHEHGGGVVVMPAPMSEEKWEEMAFKQQAHHREQIPGKTPETPITDAIIKSRGPVTVEGEGESFEPMTGDGVVELAPGD
jgi:hypothetical protein